MSKWMKLAGVALAFGIAQPAMAANCATVSFSVPTFQDFDPINGNYPTLSITANFTRIDSNAKSVRIIFADNDAGTPVKLGQSGPIYEIKANDGALIVSPSSNISNGAGALGVFSGSTASTTLSFIIPNTTTDFIGDTVFSESLKYSVQCYDNNTNGTGAGNAPSDLGVPAFILPVRIKKVVSITTAGPQTINFGNFTTTTQQLQVGLRSTSSINVGVSTLRDNQMVLAGAVPPFPANASIPYSMTLNGTPVANGTNLTNQTRAGVAGMNWPLILTLSGGLPSGKIAGAYSDTITLTLTPGT
ncbi:MAG TPA: hypothetical protein VJM09_14295 [Sphingobium sp.]|nr:hypothetical protein [Sphingobium sp.]